MAHPYTTRIRMARERRGGGSSKDVHVQQQGDHEVLLVDQSVCTALVLRRSRRGVEHGAEGREQLVPQLIHRDGSRQGGTLGSGSCGVSSPVPANYLLLAANEGDNGTVFMSPGLGLP